MKSLRRKLWRYWYYFRIGYSTYLTAVIGVSNTMILLWYVAIAQVPDLQRIFGRFLFFAIFAIGIVVPSCIVVGFAHFRRTRAFASEADITVESNPYNFKVVPGKEKELYIPMWIAQLDMLIKLTDKIGGLTLEEKAQFLSMRRGFIDLLNECDLRHRD